MLNGKTIVYLTADDLIELAKKKIADRKIVIPDNALFADGIDYMIPGEKPWKGSVQVVSVSFDLG